MKNETSEEPSKRVANNSSMITAENSSKNSKINLKRNILRANKYQKYSNMALFENPRRDLPNSQKKNRNGVYITDLTISKYRDTELDTKTTLATINTNYKTHHHFLKQKIITPNKFGKGSLPNIKTGFTKYVHNPPCFTCCDRQLNPKFLTHLYNEPFLKTIEKEFDEDNKNKKEKKILRDDKNEFLRKTNEIKRLKYEAELKKEAIEEYKENIKMQKCGIDYTISNLKSYRDNLENNFLTKYNSDIRKLEKELLILKLNNDKEKSKLNILIKEIASLRYLLIKKESTLKNIEKWLYLQIHIKEGVEPKNLNNALKRYKNQLIFNSFEELNNSLINRENRNLRLMEKYNKIQKDKQKYLEELEEKEREVKTADQAINLIIPQKENILNSLKKQQNLLKTTISSLNSNIINSPRNKKYKRSKSSKIKYNYNYNPNDELKKNGLGILYKPVKIKNDILHYIDCIYIGILKNNINGLIINSTLLNQVNNFNISKNKRTAIKMKIIEISLNYLISSINDKISSDINSYNIMEKISKIIDLYHKRINGNKNKEEVKKNWDNLMKKIEEKNKKTYYLPRGKIEKYNVVSIQKRKNEEKINNKKTKKKIDIWDFLYDRLSEENDSNDNMEIKG